MVQVSEIGLKDDEVELDLGLSIGGSFQKISEKPDPKPNIAFQLGSFNNIATRERSSTSMAVAVMDPQTKREIHALRRMEAKKKQQYKRMVRESEHEHQRPSKREKTDPLRHDAVAGGEKWPNVNLNLNGSTTVSFHQPYAFVQVNNNGYAYPCVVPLMAPCVKEKNAGTGQPAVAASNGFRPFSGNGYGSDPNGERDCAVDNKKATKSDGSSMCSSSVISDYQSSSHEGGGSSESQSQAEQSASSSHSIRSEHLNGQTSPNHDHTTVTQPHDHQIQHQQSTIQSDKKKPLSSNDKKPPKLPLPPATSTPALPKMPYVSTTGDGPNGKRVNGFLYRYSNSEVSIVCVCHGSTFSPAGFVQHAGGTDTSHPERNITVIPFSAFG